MSTEKKKAAKKTPANHYIDNDRLNAELIAWKERYNEAPEDDKPVLPEYVGYAILKIAEHRGHTHNFRNYSYLDDMISDGIQNCVRYIHNFDPIKAAAASKSGKVNAFGYISRIIEWAFINRIKIEAKQAYIKYKSIEMYGIELDSDNAYDAEAVTADFLDRAYEYEEKMGLNKKADEGRQQREPDMESGIMEFAK